MSLLLFHAFFFSSFLCFFVLDFSFVSITSHSWLSRIDCSSHPLPIVFSFLCLSLFSLFCLLFFSSLFFRFLLFCFVLSFGRSIARSSKSDRSDGSIDQLVGWLAVSDRSSAGFFCFLASQLHLHSLLLLHWFPFSSRFRFLAFRCMSSACFRSLHLCALAVAPLSELGHPPSSANTLLTSHMCRGVANTITCYLRVRSTPITRLFRLFDCREPWCSTSKQVDCFRSQAHEKATQHH